MDAEPRMILTHADLKKARRELPLGARVLGQYQDDDGKIGLRETTLATLIVLNPWCS